MSGKLEPNIKALAALGIFPALFPQRRAAGPLDTPELSIHWDGENLTESPGAVRADAPDGDPVEAV